MLKLLSLIKYIKIITNLKKYNYLSLITADHGNAEKMRDENGEIQFIDGLKNNSATTDDFKLSDVDLLETVFKDRKLVRKFSLNEIRDRIYGEF